jgi:hypothetical protein
MIRYAYPSVRAMAHILQRFRRIIRVEAVTKGLTPAFALVITDFTTPSSV